MPTTQLPFTDAEITSAINAIAPQFGELLGSGLFPEDRISTAVAQIRREGDAIVCLPSVERGGPATGARRDRQEALFLSVPHIPHEDSLRPAEIQDMMRLADSGLVSFEEELAKRLAKMRRRHDVTHEFMLWSALQGLVADGANKTIYNLFTEFGITKKRIAFNLASATADVLGKCEEVVAHIEDNLEGEVMTGVECRVSPSFFNAFIQHAKVEKYYLNHAAALNLAAPQRGDATAGTTARRFLFGNITWIEKRGAIKPFGSTTTVPFVPADQGYAYPVGASDTFALVHGPSDTVSGVNRPPVQLIEVSTEDLKHGKGVEMRTESNPLPIVKRPKLIVEVTSAAA